MMKRATLTLLALILVSSIFVANLTVTSRPVMAYEKSELEFWTGMGAAVSSLFPGSWPLEASILGHIAAIHIANYIYVGTYKNDPDYEVSVVPSDLTLPRSQTDSPDFSESLNQKLNEAINSGLAASSLCLASATATNRYYTAQAAGDSHSMKMQLGDIQSELSALRLAEVEAADRLATFAATLVSEGLDPTVTQQQFADFQNQVTTSGLPQQEADLLNSLVAKSDPILFEGFDYLSYLAGKITSITFPYSELQTSDAIQGIAGAIRHTSEVIGPFPSGVGACFIATAAYGTPLAPQIDVLRDFRDQYLITNPVGKAFVELYYKVSPPMAEFITEHPALKPVVRAALVPAVALSRVAVNSTSAEKMAILGSLALVCIALAIWVRERARRFGRGR